MTRKRFIGVAIVAAIILAGALVVEYGLNRLALGDVPMSAPPTVAPSASMTAPTPSSSASSAPLVSAVPQTPVCSGAIKGVPTHIRIVPKGSHDPDHDRLVDARIELIQLNSKLELNPPGGIAGWYGPPDWGTTPGDESKHRGIIAGHVGQDAHKGVFYDLDKVKMGDTVTIWYDNGTPAQFTVLKDALSVPKKDVTDDTKYPWVWESKRAECVVTIFTCDLRAEHNIFGSSDNNYIVQARMTSRER